ncbi:MAG: hypothetical protein ACI8TX_001658 [Hyphomicrobiaceae bacterium]|jgi:hypothetical protein
MNLFSRWRQSRRAAFWLLGAERISVCVLRRERDEPYLEACAGIRSSQRLDGMSFTPGILELARAVEAFSLPCVAALGAEFARLVPFADAEPAAEGDTSRVIGRIVGFENLRVEADTDAVVAAWGLFARAHLDLRELDAEPCAERALALFLGNTASQDPHRDVLAAVSVDPTLEPKAVELGGLLVAPVGLAIARWSAIGNTLAD